MSEHLLGVLKVGFHDRGHGRGDFGILDESEKLVAKITPHGEQAERAEIIVHCVNSHDSLLAACEKALESITTIWKCPDGETAKVLRIAITEAKAEKG